MNPTPPTNISSTAAAPIHGWSSARSHGAATLYTLDEVVAEEDGDGLENVGSVVTSTAARACGRGMVVLDAGVRVVVAAVMVELAGVVVLDVVATLLAVVLVAVLVSVVVVEVGVTLADGVPVGVVGSSWAWAIPAVTSSRASAAAATARRRVMG